MTILKHLGIGIYDSCIAITAKDQKNLHELNISHPSHIDLRAALVNIDWTAFGARVMFEYKVGY